MSSRPTGSRPARRFVEKDQLGIADDRLGELRALPHPRRELADRPESRLVEPDEVEDVETLVGAPARAGSPLNSPNVETTSAAV